MRKKNTLIYLYLLMFPFVLFSQIHEGGYSGRIVEEHIWSKVKKGYVFHQEIKSGSKVIFTEKQFFFKKGQADWKQNLITFEKTNFFEGKEYDVYSDEREQQLLIDNQKNEILYYYNWDKVTNSFKNLAIYKKLQRDDSVLKEVQSLYEESKPSKFRIDYNKISIFDHNTEKWSDWGEGLNTFVINMNENGDIMHIKGNGAKAIYRRLSEDVENDYAGQDKHYQLIKALDEDGNTFSFQIFDDATIGLKMMYKDVIIQFAQ